MEELRAALMVPAALALPSAALARHLGLTLSATERLLIGLALAPFALGIVALPMALWARVSIGTCLLVAEVAWLAVALWPTPRGSRPSSHSNSGRGDAFPVGPVLVSAAILTVFVAAPLIQIPFLRMWSDAWFHSGVAIEIAERGVPPQDPNFAGIPLYYFWFYHFVLALLGAASGASPFHQQAMLNVWAAAVMALAAAHLTHRLFGRAAAAWAGPIAILGLNPLGWGIWVAHGVRGESRGLELMLSQIRGIGWTGTAMAEGFSITHSSMLNRFWTGTAMTLALALAVALTWCVVQWLERPTRGEAIRLLLTSGALMAFHPAIGALAVLFVCGGLGLIALGGGPRVRAIAAGGLLALVVAVSMFYVRACSMPGGSTSASLGLYRVNAWAMAIAIAPWLLVALPKLVEAWRGGPAQRFAAATLLVASVATIVLVLPERNSEKMVFMAWLAASPFAAAALTAPRGSRWTRPLSRALLVAGVVPTQLIFTTGVYRENQSPGTLIRGETTLPLVTPGEAAAYRWLERESPRDAVVIEKPRPTVNEPVPVLARRRVFCGSLDVYLHNHFGDVQPRNPESVALLEDFRVRRRLQLAMFEGRAPDTGQVGYLNGFTAPLFLLVRRDDVEPVFWQQQRPGWTEVVVTDEVKLYRRAP